MADKTQVIADCELMRCSLMDLSAIDADIERLQEECEFVAELVKAVFKENDSPAHSQ